MRWLLSLIAWFGCLALVAGGGAFAFVGFADLQTEREAYRADFGRSGDDCGRGMVHLHVETGESLDCGIPGLRSMPGREPKTQGLTGLTAEQRRAVYTEARSLGSDGLSEVEQNRIQALIDEYKATVASADRYRAAERWRGIPQAWFGAALAGAGGVAMLILRRFRP